MAAATCSVEIEDIAESELMETLVPEQARAFEDHYVGYDACAIILQNTIEYVIAMRSAPAELFTEVRGGASP